jgi:hypothetical protein
VTSASDETHPTRSRRSRDILQRWGDRSPVSPCQIERGAIAANCSFVGGLRSPYLDVPTSTWFGSSTGPSFCSIAGHEVSFGEAQLAELYRSDGDYVGKVARDTARLMADRFLTVPDGLR